MSNHARTSMILAGMLTVLVAAPVQRASADNKDNPVVLNAVADLSLDRLVINGRDFDGRGPLHVLLGGAPLTVVSAARTRIVAALPASIEPRTYLLVVGRGRDHRGHDDDFAAFEVAIGAVGPAGPQGSGPQGVQGPPGAGPQGIRAPRVSQGAKGDTAALPGRNRCDGCNGRNRTAGCDRRHRSLNGPQAGTAGPDLCCRNWTHAERHDVRCRYRHDSGARHWNLPRRAGDEDDCRQWFRDVHACRRAALRPSRPGSSRSTPPRPSGC